MGLIELFHCRPFNTGLKRSICAQRHERARTEARHQGVQGRAHLIGGGQCATCEVGAAHARGEQPSTWPDGELIQIRTLTPRSEERLDRRGSPSLAGGRGALRAAEPADASCSGPQSSPAPELDEGADSSAARRASGARAAERSAAEEATTSPADTTGGDAVESEPAQADAGPAPVPANEEDPMDHDEPTPPARPPRTCIACGEGYQPSGRAQKYCSAACRPSRAKPSPAKPSPAKPKSQPKAEPKRDARIDGALALIDERIAELEAQINQFCIAGNALCTAAGIEPLYEVE